MAASTNRVWETVQLGNEDLFEFENGIWTGKKPPLSECAVLRNTNFGEEGKLDYSNVAKLQIEARLLERKRLLRGDIIIERSGGGPTQPVGRVAYFDEENTDFCFSNFTSRLRVRKPDMVEPRFLHLFLLFFHISGETEMLQRRTTGIRNLDFNEYLKTQVPLPCIVEQRRITHFLQLVQKAKDIRHHELSLERERKAALMDYVFTQGTRGERTKESPVGTIPASWKVVRLSDACKVKTSFPAFTVLASLDSSVTSDELVLGLKVSDMNLPGNERFIRDSQTKFRIPHSKLPAQVLPPQSVVFPKRGASIATNKKRITTTYSILDPNLIGIESNAFLNSQFLFAFFERFDLRNLQDNTPIPQLNKNDVERVPIPLPSEEERNIIGELMEAMDKKIAGLVSEIQRLGELFFALLEELMSGRLRLHVLTEEGTTQ